MANVSLRIGWLDSRAERNSPSESAVRRFKHRSQRLIDILRLQTETLRLETATLGEYFPLVNEFAPIFQAQREMCVSALSPNITTTTNADGKFEFHVPVGLYAVWTSDALHVGDAVLAWADVIEITDDHSVVLSEPIVFSSEPFRELVSEAPGKLSDGPFIELDFVRLQQLRTIQVRAVTVGQSLRK